MKQKVTLTINGKSVTEEVEPRTLLIHFLRESQNLTGAHIGCETSLCGACTVEVDGKAIKSCAMFTVQAHGKSITTIEGSPKMATIIRFRTLSGKNTDSSVVTVRPE